MANIKPTKLAQNPKYGLPSGRKLRNRLAGWRQWAKLMAMLRQIHLEEADKLAANRESSLMVLDSNIPNSRGVDKPALAA